MSIEYQLNISGKKEIKSKKKIKQVSAMNMPFIYKKPSLLYASKFQCDVTNLAYILVSMCSKYLFSRIK